MVITDLVFEQMYCRFEGAMGFHCNRRTEKKHRLYDIRKEKWTGTLLHPYSHIGNSHRAHQQISTGIRTQLVAYINFSDCLYSCPYISDIRESLGDIRQYTLVFSFFKKRASFFSQTPGFVSKHRGVAAHEPRGCREGTVGYINA